MSTMNRKKDEYSVETRIIDLINYAEKKTNIVISYNEIYSFIARYSLVTSKKDFKSVSLKSLISCRNCIQETYEMSYKHNVLSTRNNIDKWITITQEYLKFIRQKDRNKEKFKEVDFKFDIFKYITIETVQVNFKEVFQEYKDVYMIPDDKTGDIKQFKKYLGYTFRKIDEVQFFKALMEAGVDKDNL